MGLSAKRGSAEAVKKIAPYGWNEPAIISTTDKEQWIRKLVSELEKTIPSAAFKGHWRSEPRSVLSGDTLLEVSLVRWAEETEIHVEVREYLPRGGYRVKYPLED